jgi:hypothetical protein
MEKISRSVHQAKQAKFLDADCTCPYSPYSLYSDMAGPYNRTVMTWKLLVGWLLANQVLKRVSLVVNGMRARGPMLGRHVSLVGWFIIAM